MKAVLLHIGASKTGTTSLQALLERVLGNSGEREFGYPSAARGRHARGAHHNLFYDPIIGGLHNDSFATENGGWDELLQEIDRSNYEVGVVSSEAFQYCRPDQVDRVRAVLDGRRVKVVAYVRRHDSWLASAWNQRARFGRVSLDFDQFVESGGREMADWARWLEPWIRVFGDDNVDVRIFETVSRDPGVHRDFLRNCLGRAAVQAVPSVPAKNTRAGVKQLVAVAAVCRDCRAEFGVGFVLSRRGAQRISEFFRSRSDCRDFSILTAASALALHRSYGESDARLRSQSSSFRAAGPFPLPRADEYRNTIDVASVDESMFDDEERRFVKRMVRETVRATRNSEARSS